MCSGPSDLFSLPPVTEDMPTKHGNEARELVEIESLDNFCSGHEIDQISFLKIDTEGYDLEVLKGASRMLGEQRIDLVEVEAGMNCLNKTHVPFEDLKAYLEKMEYYLFAIYEQVGEWPKKEPQLRRANAVFISRHVIEQSPSRGKRVS